MRYLLLWLVFFNVAASAGIYQWKDENGKLHFSDKPPLQAQKQKQLKQISAQPVKSKTQAVPSSTHTSYSTDSLNINSQKLQLRAMLKRKDYTRLNKRLALLAQLRAADISKDQDEFHAYDAFGVPTDAMFARLNLWVST